MKVTDWVFLIALALLPAAACGSNGTSTRSDDGAVGGSPGTGGATGQGGLLATGGSSGGAGGAGGSSGTLAVCPAAVPQSGTACSVANCYYEDCAGAGRTAASCRNGAWALENAPCDVVACGNVTCPAGQICLQRQGGALISECLPNACGSGAIACDCLGSCSGSCSILGSSTGGVKVTCAVGCADPRGCP